MEKEITDEMKEELIILMRDRDFDKEQATGIYLHALHDKIVKELIDWLKANPNANEEDTVGFLIDNT